MRSKKLSAILLVSTLTMSLAVVPVSQAVIHADDQVTTSAISTSATQTHTLNKSYVVYGAGAASKDELNTIWGLIVISPRLQQLLMITKSTLTRMIRPPMRQWLAQFQSCRPILAPG